MSKRTTDATFETDSSGKFARTASSYREFISNEHPIYKPACGRYHLYVSHACPWANRATIFLNMKGLQDCISLSVVHPTWRKTRPNDDSDSHYGWAFVEPEPDVNGDFVMISRAGAKISVKDCVPDFVNGCKYVRDLYEMSDTQQTKFTVPILWDKETKTIVNNESSEIIRMLNCEFNEWAKKLIPDMYPGHLRGAVDEVNEWVYENISNGVYRCGFATTQSAYDEAVSELSKALDRVELILSKSRYLVSNDQITEADIRLFVTLIRFDEVYVVYFKCNCRMISQYPNMMNYLRELYQLPDVAASIKMDHIKKHYFTSHPNLNCYSIVPAGPNTLEDLLKPHNRMKIAS